MGYRRTRLTFGSRARHFGCGIGRAAVRSPRIALHPQRSFGPGEMTDRRFVPCREPLIRSLPRGKLKEEEQLIREGFWARATGLGLGLAGIVLTAGGLLGCGGTTTTVSTVVKGQAVVQVTAPVSGTVINASSVTVRGTVSPPNATVQVAGTPAAVGNGVFTGTAPLGVGKTTIDVIASAPGLTPGSTSVVLTRPGGGGGRAPKSNNSSNAAVNSGSGATPGVANASPNSGSGQTGCGGGLSVGPGTTCAFASNVRAAYSGPGTYQVFSPVTNQSYSMTCNTNSGQVVCTGGNNASVYFPG